MLSTSICIRLHLLGLLAFSQSVLADLSLQELQPIANFPSSCQTAYTTPIQNCPDASSFSISGTNSSVSVCSSDCITALDQATQLIQKACGGSSAPPGTVIAHAFQGNLTLWLCTTGVGGSSSSSSNSNPSNTAQSQSSTADLTQSSSGSTKTQTQTSASGTTSLSGSTLATSVLPSQTSTSVSQTSSQISITQSSSSSKPEPTLKSDGGGSPFDQTVPNSATKAETWAMFFSLALCIAIAWGPGI